MSIFRFLSFALVCAVFCCAVFSVPVSAAIVEQYSYNGVVLPKSPYNDDSLSVIGVKDGVFYAVGYWMLPSRILIDVSGSDCYVLLNGEWVIPSIGYIEDIQIIWASQDIVSLDGDLLLAGSIPDITWVDMPVTVFDILSDTGSIFASAISWVGDVGSTILQQPLLLAFCALPLCGIGIGVYRRLRGID